MDIIEVSGTDGERVLLDFICEGSTVAQLIFDLDVVRILKARNANFHSIMLTERDVQEQATIVRTKVYKLAFRELGKWRKNSTKVPL